MEEGVNRPIFLSKISRFSDIKRLNTLMKRTHFQIITALSLSKFGFLFEAMIHVNVEY